MKKSLNIKTSNKPDKVRFASGITQEMNKSSLNYLDLEKHISGIVEHIMKWNDIL